MTTATPTHDQSLAKALDDVSYRLYDKSEWEQRNKSYDKFGLDIQLYDMKCSVFETLFDEQPDMFADYQWINDDNGMPLWVRPGVEWIPEYELEDEYA